MDYTTDYHALTLAVSFQPIEKLTLSGSVTYTYSEASFDNVHFKNIIPELRALNPTAPQNYAWGAFTKDWPEHQPTFDEMDNWSDLQIETWEVNLDANYQLTKNLSVDVSFNWQDFNDEEYYIYDGDGTFYWVGATINYKF
ncbi:hypothetical protein TST_1591 [Thermosulfidibacter takaii ABI70S6]|uniref:TonB-dependent receptor n=1 Tax=Thermosulfidibacter takaii (strain DSM 17441 / JCM 13301 / NBRC 103674 / ABI70S6) TaxID=1298851 RepID=A0A0S3QVM6_THET7|nr:hypothetical protein TST_1591 [Thermosulfidibacter takaii ABI70S6]